MKTKNVLIVVSLMLAFYLIVPTYAAVDTLIPENATTVTTQSGLGCLSPPPDEALFVPPIEQEPVSPLVTYATLGLIATILAISGIIFYKKKNSKLTKAFIPMVICGIFLSALCYQVSLVSASGEDFGNPLVTTNIGLFAYYYYGSGFTLNDTVPAFQSYSDHGNYYDGMIRVWQDATGTDFEGADEYIDVYCRVRADGWILTWYNQSDSKAMIPYWGRGSLGYSSGPTTQGGLAVANATTLSRAMYRVFNAASISWVGYDSISYFDYEYTNATKLVFIQGFGDNIEDEVFENGGYLLIGYTIPESSTPIAAWASGSEPDYYQTNTWFILDDTTTWYCTQGVWNARNMTDYALATGVQHKIEMGGSGNYGTDSIVMLMIWFA